jgi:hypothetical protein
VTRPGDKQPVHRSEVLHAFREAARVRRQLARSMQSVERAVMTPEQRDRLEQHILDLARQEQ